MCFTERSGHRGLGGRDRAYLRGKDSQKDRDSWRGRDSQREAGPLREIQGFSQIDRGSHR